MPKCSLPHSHKPCISLTNSKPAGERLYETFGGTSPVTVRRTTPSRSSCRNCAVSTFSLILASRLVSSAKRFGPNAKFHRIDTFHLPRITATVACTGQPCLTFTLLPRPFISTDSKSLRRLLPAKTTHPRITDCRFASRTDIGLQNCAYFSSPQRRARLSH